MLIDPYEKLDNFTSVITADAVSESMHIYEDIKRESQSVLTAAEDELLEETYRYIKSEVSRVHTESGRAVSRKMMEGRRQLYARRAEMGDEVMAQVTDRLRGYVQTPEYTEQLRRIIGQAVEVFGADTIIYLREADKALVPELSKVKSSHRLEFQTGDFALGGLMAVCPSKRLQADETFDTKVVELRGQFAELFGLEMKA